MQLQSTLLAAPLTALLALALAPHARAQCPADAFEPNDTCQEAADLPFGTHSGLTAANVETDWYRFEVPAGQSFYVDFAFAQASGNTAAFVDLREEDPSGCATGPGQGNLPSLYANPLEQQSFRFRWDSPASESRVYFLELFFFGSDDCTEYDLSVTLAPNDCLLTADTGLEDNDACDSPVAIGTGRFPGQRVSVSDPDYYSVTAAPGELLTVIASGFPLGTQFNFFAWNPAIGCGGSLTAGGVVSFGQQTEVGFYLFNDGPASRTWTVQLQPLPNQLDETGFCFDYDLELRSEGDLCQPDALEPNDDCFNAPTVAPGFYGDLNIRVGDQEHLFVTIPAGTTLRAISTATTPATQRPMHLYGGCGNDFLTSSQFYQSSAKQILEWTNSTGSDVEGRLFLWNTGSAYPFEFCPTYSLDLEVSLGQKFCAGNPNSTGLPSSLSALGSKVVGSGVTTFQANHLPQAQFGLVFFGFDVQPPAALGNGKLCIAPTLLRLAPASTGTGILETTIDWADPGVASAILPGQAAYFQTWYRDPAAGAAGSNTSGGLSVQFD